MVKVIRNKKTLYKLLFFVALVLPASNAFADGNTTDFSITVNPSVSLSVSSSAVGFEITPTQAGAYNSANFTVTSATNNVYGYTLTMSTNNVNLTSNTVNPNTGTNPTIPTLTETQAGISAADFQASTDSNVLNHYGVAIGANNYNAMKASSIIKRTAENNTTADSTTVNLASKLDLLTVPGTYSTTLNFQIVANPLPGTLEDAFLSAGKRKATINGQEYYSMQDMQSIICDNVSVVDDQIQVYDNRDNKIYWIAKLKDGHCWMTQNLDLDLETTPNHVLALTSENTDLNTFGSNGYDTNNGYSQEDGVITWTPERNTIPTSSISSTGSISGWTNDHNNPYSIDTGNWYWIGNWKNNGTDTWYSSTPNIYLNTDGSGAGDKFSMSEYTGNGKHGHVGNYYNWSATIASNDSSSYNASTLADITTNPQNSICPSGWRLPTISNASDTDGSTNEFRRLVTLYGNTTSNDKALTASPLWFVRGGYVYSSSLYLSGNNGFYWSSTVGSSNYAYSLDFLSSFVNPAYYETRLSGESVRCIAR